MKKLSLAALAALCGCAQLPPANLSGGPAIAVTSIHAGAVRVDDRAANKEAVPVGVYSSGWKIIPDTAFSPSFHQSLAKRMGQSVHGTGGPALTLTLLDADLASWVSSADSVPFIGIASALSDRRYRCTATLNLKLDGQIGQRRNYERFTVMNRDFGDLDLAQRQRLAADCRDSLVKAIAEDLALTL